MFFFWFSLKSNLSAIHSGPVQRASTAVSDKSGLGWPQPVCLESCLEIYHPFRQNDLNPPPDHCPLHVSVAPFHAVQSCPVSTASGPTSRARSIPSLIARSLALWTMQWHFGSTVNRSASAPRSNTPPEGRFKTAGPEGPSKTKSSHQRNSRRPRDRQVFNLSGHRGRRSQWRRWLW